MATTTTITGGSVEITPEGTVIVTGPSEVTTTDTVTATKVIEPGELHVIWAPAPDGSGDYDAMVGAMGPVWQGVLTGEAPAGASGVLQDAAWAVSIWPSATPGQILTKGPLVMSRASDDVTVLLDGERIRVAVPRTTATLHLALVADGVGLRLFVNGALRSSARMKVHDRMDTVTEPLTVPIASSIAVFARAITEAEITQLARVVAPNGDTS